MKGPVLELLTENTHAFASALGERVLATQLNWEEPISDLVLTRGPFDCILVADCTYNESVYDLLMGVITRLSNPSTNIFISHTLRSTHEQEVLMGVCLEKGLSFEIVWNIGNVYYVYRLSHKQKNYDK